MKAWKIEPGEATPQGAKACEVEVVEAAERLAGLQYHRPRMM